MRARLDMVILSLEGVCNRIAVFTRTVITRDNKSEACTREKREREREWGESTRSLFYSLWKKGRVQVTVGMFVL